MAQAKVNTLEIQHDLEQQQKKALYHYPKPKELVHYSIRLKEEDEEPNFSVSNSERVDSIVSRYPASKQYSRTVDANPESNLRVLIDIGKAKQPPNYDLKVGYGEQTEKDRENEYLGTLLECLTKENLVGKSDFVFRRGYLTDIGSSIIDANSSKDSGLRIVAQRLNGVIYLQEFELVETELAGLQKFQTYYGLKFESYVAAQPNKEPDHRSPMDFNKEFLSTVMARLGSHSLIFAGEVDACMPGNSAHYVEIKTRKVNLNEHSFRKYKLFKWWLQSFLLGIDDILCGYRDDNEGLITEMSFYHVPDMPKKAKREKHSWNPEETMQYLNEFLDKVKAEVTEDLVPYVFTRQPKSLKFDVLKDEEGEFKFLPLWFTSRK